MVISGSRKHGYTQPEIQRSIWQVLNRHYTKARSSLVYSVNYKNDDAVLATALRTPNRLRINNYIFWKNKGDCFQIPRSNAHINRY